MDFIVRQTEKDVSVAWFIERTEAGQILASKFVRIWRGVVVRVALACLHPSTVGIDALLGCMVQPITDSERVSPLPRAADADSIRRHPPSFGSLPLHPDRRTGRGT